MRNSDNAGKLTNLEELNLFSLLTERKRGRSTIKHPQPPTQGKPHNLLHNQQLQPADDD